jgi:hypothetical protein
MYKFNSILVKVFICFLAGFILMACGGKYGKKEEKVFYSYWPNENSRKEYEVQGADIESFKVLKGFFFVGKIYAVDKYHAYYRGLAIENADVTTFKAINEYYSVDNGHIFWSEKVLSTANPQTLKILVDEYALDSDSVYYQGKVLSGADSKTFTTIGHYYAKDKNFVYNQGRIASEIADPATFRLLSKKRYKEVKNWFGFFRELSSGIDYLSDWGCDKYYYYYSDCRIDSADYPTFTLLDGGRCYARDKYHIFYADYDCAPILEGADPETFEIVNRSRNFAKDKNRYYLHGGIISYEDAVKQKLLKK